MTRSVLVVLDWNSSVTALLVIGSTLWFGQQFVDASSLIWNQRSAP
jgi:hypothetical protein